MECFGNFVFNDTKSYMYNKYRIVMVWGYVEEGGDWNWDV